MLPGIDDSTLIVIAFQKQDSPTFAEAIRKADMEVMLQGVRSSGTLIMAKYHDEPNIPVSFEAGTLKGGTGQTGIKFTDILVQDAKQGTANVTLHYSNDEVSGYDTSTLSLYYYFGGKWLKCNHIVNSPQTNSISGDIPVIRLNGTVIGLGGNSVKGTGAANLSGLGDLGGNNQAGFLNSANETQVGWMLVGIIVVSIIILGIAGFYFINRNRSANAHAKQ